MSCNCNTPKNKSLCQLLDLDVAYTGNAMEVNGVYIRSGDNLRIVLDAILKGDQDQPTEEITNFWFGMLAPTEDNPANINDYYLQGDGKIWQYTQPVPTVPASWVDTGVTIGGEAPEWGEITGDINLQTDLLTFIQENALSADSVGKNMNLSEDGKINAGIDLSALLPPGTNALALSESGSLDLAAGEKNYLLLSGGTLNGVFENSVALQSVIGGELRLDTSNQGGYLKANSPFRISSDGLLTINGPSGESNGLFLETTGEVRLRGTPQTNIHGSTINIGATVGSITSVFNAYSGKIYLYTGSGADDPGLLLQDSRAGQLQEIRLGYRVQDNTNFIGISMPDSPTNNDENFEIKIVSGSLQAQYATYLTYDRSLPATAPALALVTKEYVDALQTQIDALEARVAALETP